jgi:hypothetical protein
MQIAERDTIVKKVKANWAREWATNLDAAERYAATEVRKFYDSQAAIALDIFKRKGAIGADDVQFLYNAGDFTKLYEGIYESIGLRFAKWYAQNFDKLIKKGVNPSGLVEPWRAYFKLVGASVAAERVSLVQGTARQNLIDVTRRLSTDDVFINEGAEVRARMVRQKFNQYSQYQAERLVRTEATNIANIATETAAEDIFPGTDMQKEWISASDTRTRRFANKDFADHAFMDGKVVDFDKPFEVPTIRGIELLMRPGATNGSPGNVINCRCSMAPFPKEGAQTVGEITDLGFGVADTLTAEGLSQLGTTVQTAVQAAVAEANIVASKPAQAVDEFVPAKTVKDAKNYAVSQFEKIGVDVKQISAARNMDVDRFNIYNKQLNNLFNEYQIDHKLNKGSRIKLLFQTKEDYYGRVSRYGHTKRLEEINFGSLTDSIENRTRVLSKTEFVSMPKSAVDAANNNIATLTHEFAHVISNSRFKDLAFHDELWDEVRDLKSAYYDEMYKYKTAKDFAKFNETYLGGYASTNLNEFFAEAFTEYKLSSNPSKYAKLVGELIDKYFKN